MTSRRFLLHALPLSLAAGAPSLFNPLAHAAEEGITPQSITLGSSLALSGPLGGGGREHLTGIQAAMLAVNQAGGINGRELKLDARDDAYLPARTVENVRQMLDTGSCLALLSCMGTPNNAGIFPLVEQMGVPLVGPISGANSLRQAQQRNVFHVRASYGDETARVVQQLAAVGMKEVAIVYLDNAFGKEVLQGAQQSLEERSMRLVSSQTLAVDGSNATAVVSALVARKPGAVMLATAGAATTPVLLGLRKQMVGMPVVGLSVAFVTSELASLGAASQGLALSQVFPDPEKPKLAVVRQYQANMKAAGFTTLGSRSFEGWVNTQLMAEGLRRAGREINRDKLRQALAGIRRLDLGDFSLGYAPGVVPYVASRFVDLAVLGAEGRRLS